MTNMFAPTADELAAFKAFDDVVQWLEIDDPLKDALMQAAGAKPTTPLRVWARISPQRWQQLANTMKVTEAGTEREMTPVEESQIGELASIFSMMSGGPSPPPATAHGQPGTPTGVGLQQADAGPLRLKLGAG